MNFPVIDRGPNVTRHGRPQQLGLRRFKLRPGITRLHNACDACHKLKRRCTGGMPCENCVSTGSSCLYSVVGRLGRPRGSRSLNVGQNISSSSQSKPQSRPPLGHRQSYSPPSATSSTSASAPGAPDHWTQQDHHVGQSQAVVDMAAFPAPAHDSVDSDMTDADLAACVGFDNLDMLFLDTEFDNFDTTSFYEPSTGSTQKSPGPDGAGSLISTSSSDVDAFQHLNHSPVWHGSTSTSTSLSHSITGSSPPISMSISPASQRISWQQHPDPQRLIKDAAAPFHQQPKRTLVTPSRARPASPSVTTMQSLLCTKQARAARRRGESDTAMLLHVESLLDELARGIKQLQ